MHPTAQLIAVAISALAVFGAFAAWLVRHMDRRLDEARADTRRGFERMREDFQRLENKFDAQSEQMANLRQDVGRLQGIVERTYEPARFTLPPAQEERVGGGVGEVPASYETGAGGEDPARSDEP